jgi:hypothetical protein
MKIFTTFVLKKGVRCKKEESVEHKGGKWLKERKGRGEAAVILGGPKLQGVRINKWWAGGGGGTFLCSPPICT